MRGDGEEGEAKSRGGEKPKQVPRPRPNLLKVFTAFLALFYRAPTDETFSGNAHCRGQTKCKALLEVQRLLIQRSSLVRQT
jgi:hypothetical protein